MSESKNIIANQNFCSIKCKFLLQFKNSPKYIIKKRKKLMKKIKLGKITFSNKSKFVLIGGVNVLESKNFAIDTASYYKEICSKLNIPLIFKASYDKANRSSHESYRGPGIVEGMQIFREVKNKLSLPIVTDVHTKEEAKIAGEVCDIIQIPAFLARQTDLVNAIAKTNKIVNIKTSIC